MNRRKEVAESSRSKTKKEEKGEEVEGKMVLMVAVVEGDRCGEERQWRNFPGGEELGLSTSPIRLTWTDDLGTCRNEFKTCRKHARRGRHDVTAGRRLEG